MNVLAVRKHTFSTYISETGISHVYPATNCCWFSCVGTQDFGTIYKFMFRRSKDVNVPGIFLRHYSSQHNFFLGGDLSLQGCVGNIDHTITAYNSIMYVSYLYILIIHVRTEKRIV